METGMPCALHDSVAAVRGQPQRASLLSQGQHKIINVAAMPCPSRWCDTCQLVLRQHQWPAPCRRMQSRKPDGLRDAEARVRALTYEVGTLREELKRECKRRERAVLKAKEADDSRLVLEHQVNELR
jgi:hypothetical protein